MILQLLRRISRGPFPVILTIESEVEIAAFLYHIGVVKCRTKVVLDPDAGYIVGMIVSEITERGWQALADAFPEDRT